VIKLGIMIVSEPNQSLKFLQDFVEGNYDNPTSGVPPKPGTLPEEHSANADNEETGPEFLDEIRKELADPNSKKKNKDWAIEIGKIYSLIKNLDPNNDEKKIGEYGGIIVQIREKQKRNMETSDRDINEGSGVTQLDKSESPEDIEKYKTLKKIWDVTRAVFIGARKLATGTAQFAVDTREKLKSEDTKLKELLEQYVDLDRTENVTYEELDWGFNTIKTYKEDDDFTKERYDQLLSLLKEAGLDLDISYLIDFSAELRKLENNDLAAEVLKDTEAIIADIKGIHDWIDKLFSEDKISFLQNIHKMLVEKNAVGLALYVQKGLDELEASKENDEFDAKRLEAENERLNKLEVERTNLKNLLDNFYQKLEEFLEDDDLDQEEIEALKELLVPITKLFKSKDLKATLAELDQSRPITIEDKESNSIEVKNYLQQEVQLGIKSLEYLIKEKQQFSKSLLLVIRKLEEVESSGEHNFESVAACVRQFEESLSAAEIDDDDSNKTKNKKRRIKDNLEDSLSEFFKALGEPMINQYIEKNSDVAPTNLLYKFSELVSSDDGLTQATFDKLIIELNDNLKVDPLEELLSNTRKVEKDTDKDGDVGDDDDSDNDDDEFGFEEEDNALGDKYEPI